MSSTDNLVVQLSTGLKETGKAIGSAVGYIENQIKALVSGHSTDYGTLQSSITSLTASLNTLSSGLDTEKLKELQDVAGLLQTDTNLQGSIATLQGLISQNQDALAAVNALETTLGGNFTALTGRVSNLEDLTKALNAAIAGTNDALAVANQTITSLTGRVTAVEASVAGITSDLASISIDAAGAIQAGFALANPNGASVSIGGVDYPVDVK